MGASQPHTSYCVWGRLSLCQLPSRGLTTAAIALPAMQRQTHQWRPRLTAATAAWQGQPPWAHLHSHTLLDSTTGMHKRCPVFTLDGGLSCLKQTAYIYKGRISPQRHI